MSAPRDGVALDRLWAVPVVLASIAAALTARAPIVVLPLLGIALVPWVLVVTGVLAPRWLFGALAVVPVALLIVVEDLNAAMFLGTAALSLLASQTESRGRLAVISAVGVVLPFTAFAAGWSFDPGAIYFAIGDLFGIAVGLLVARTRRLGAELRAADARLATAEAQEERTRLARDVHDLVAHSLTVVVLQVGGARRVLRTDPASAEEALLAAERVARDSLDGIREVVGLLRSDDEGSGASLDLGRLVGTYREADVPIQLELDGDPEELPLLVRGTLYRVVREALANAARYRTSPAPVDVRVRVTDDEVIAGIVNACRAGDRRGSQPGGFGLAGLGEQVSGIGGSLRSGPVRTAPGAEERWEVECRIPRSASAVSTTAVSG